MLSFCTIPCCKKKYLEHIFFFLGLKPYTFLILKRKKSGTHFCVPKGGSGGRFDLWANWTRWTPLNVEVFLTWDLFSWWFSTDSGGKSPFFTTISRNIFPFCSHPTNCNKQIQVSNTARIRFRVPQQISLNQQKHRFISPIRCAFRDEHRFPAGFEFHEKSLWFV